MTNRTINLKGGIDMASYSLENEFSSGDRGTDLLEWSDRIQTLCTLMASGLDPLRFSELALIIRDYAQAMQSVLKAGGPVLLSCFNNQKISMLDIFKCECDRVCDPKNKGFVCLEIEASELLAKVKAFRWESNTREMIEIEGRLNAFLGPGWSK